MPLVDKKTLARNGNMNGVRKPIRKKSDKKLENSVKIKVKLPHVNKKSPSRKPIFVRTPFSHSTLN